jgi:hypothetical protein
VHNRSPKRWSWPAVAALLLLLPQGASRAAGIDALKVDLHDGQFRVSFHLDGAFTPDVEELLSSGLPISFRHTLRAYRRRATWLDRLVSQKAVTTTAHFDTLTKQYRLSRSVDEQMADTRLTDKPEEMKTWMTLIEGVDLPVEAAGEPQDRYYIRVKSEIQKRFVFFFIPWDFETAWTRSALIDRNGALQP